MSNWPDEWAKMKHERDELTALRERAERLRQALGNVEQTVPGMTHVLIATRWLHDGDLADDLTEVEGA